MTTETKVIGGMVLVTLAILIIIVVVSGRSTSTSTDPIAVENPELVREHSRIIGKADAQVTLVEFGDFQCPACAATNPVVNQLLADYPETLRFVFRNYPLSIHPNAEPAARVAEAAGEQGKYREMFDKLYDSQKQWSVSSNPNLIFDGYASDLGLDLTRFATDKQSDKVTQAIRLDKGDGDALNVPGTPTLYINGTIFNEAPSYDTLKSRIDAALTQTPAL